jgi:glyoxylase-like metal-dependent hydrolase (beta-lactamase superfamily II)
MRATSAAQAAAAVDLSVPDMEEIRQGTWAVPLGMPDSSLGYVLSYLIADDAGGLHSIDPGWANDENWRVLVTAIDHLGRTMSDVRTISLTHLHADHVGLAAKLQAASDARLTMGAVEYEGMRELAHPMSADSAQIQLDGWGVPPARQGEILGTTFPSRLSEPLVPDSFLVDGAELDIPGRTVRVVHTPGHTSGHLCFVDDQEQLLFTGDHVLPTVYPGLGLGGTSASNPVVDYLASLERLAPYDRFEVLPGHGYRFRGLASRRAELADHVQQRTDGVAVVLEANPSASVWQIAERLEWSLGWHNLRGAMLRSALLQTAMHVERVRS